MCKERWKALVRLVFEDGNERVFPVQADFPAKTPIIDIVDLLEDQAWDLAQEEGCPMSQCEECTTDASEEEI